MSAPCPRFGFSARMHFVDGLDSRSKQGLMRELLDELGRLGLHCHGGGPDREWRLTIFREGGQAEHRDRESIEAWTVTHPEIVRVVLGDLVDLNDDG